MILTCFAMLSLFFITVAAEEYTRHTQLKLEARWQVATTDPPTVKWSLAGVYACFLSVSKSPLGACERDRPSAPPTRC